jgi:hypothetical protein
MVTIYTSSRGDPLLQIDSVHLKHLLIQTAANIIATCKSYPHDGSEPKDSAIGQILASKVNWAFNGYVNALQAQVQLLYSAVGEMVKPEGMSRLFIVGLEKSEAELIAQALQEFQDWKTAFCKHEQEKEGENFGTETGFFKATWTDRNDQLFALFKQ